jgi:hypothetical protein
VNALEDFLNQLNVDTSSDKEDGDYDMDMMYEEYYDEYEDDYEAIYIEEKEGGFNYIVLQMTNDFFVENVQYELQDDSQSINVHTRISFKNADGDLISYTETVGGVETTVEMTDDFYLNITGSGDANACESALAEVKT